MISDSWFNSQTVRVTSYVQSIASQRETGTTPNIYTELPTAVGGFPSTGGLSIMGQLNHDELLVTWRQSDLTNGVPRVKDLVEMNSTNKLYEVIEIQDHTLFASHFSMPRHVVAKLKEKPT